MKRTCLFIACGLVFLLSACQTHSNMPLLQTSIPTPTFSVSDGWLRVAYFPSWGPKTSQVPPLDIPADYLTHLNYAFVVPNANGACIPDSTVASNENIPALQALKKKYANLKLMISIGGGGDLENKFENVVSSPENLANFTTSCLALMKNWGFDGMDLDWEFTKPDFTQPYTALLTEMRRQLDQQSQAEGGRRYYLTMAAPAGPWGIARLELDKIYPIVDWINLMTYNYYGSWSDSTGLNAPLHLVSADPQGLSVDKTVLAYLNAGVPANKLVLGVPFFGAAWQGVGAGQNGLFQPNQGIFSAGAFDYREIKDKYVSSFTAFWEDTARVPWLYDAAQGVMISYDDPRSLKEKAAYARSLGLAGVMIWQITGDDSEHSLLKAVSIP
jgi:chitinase